MKRIFLILAAVVLAGCRTQAPSAGTAFQPSNPPEMKPIASHNTPAYRTAKLFMRGVNLGNYLEAPPGQPWGVTVSADEFTIMHAEGFDHVRAPVGWHHYAGPAPDFTLTPEIPLYRAFRYMLFTLTLVMLKRSKPERP